MSASHPVTYRTYLDLDGILNAQHTAAPPDLGSQVYAAEHFFIVVHQAFELWFKQLLLDLDCAAVALGTAPFDPELALDHLHRAAAILRLLSQQMALFDHLTPRSFLAFRPYLGSASGSQSAQYHAVQRALGLPHAESSAIFTAFKAALETAGLTLRNLYESPSRYGALYRVAEAFVDISMNFWQLTALHVQMVERTIGQKPGTGGTSGAAYLAEALKSKAFPELWDLRTRL